MIYFALLENSTCSEQREEWACISFCWPHIVAKSNTCLLLWVLSLSIRKNMGSLLFTDLTGMLQQTGSILFEGMNQWLKTLPLFYSHIHPHICDKGKYWQIFIAISLKAWGTVLLHLNILLYEKKIKVIINSLSLRQIFSQRNPPHTWHFLFGALAVTI